MIFVPPEHDRLPSAVRQEQQLPFHCSIPRSWRSSLVERCVPMAIFVAGQKTTLNGRIIKRTASEYDVLPKKVNVNVENGIKKWKNETCNEKLRQ